MAFPVFLTFSGSNTGKDKSREEGTIDGEGSPSVIERGRRLGGDDLINRLARLFQCRNLVANRCQHAAEFDKFRLPSHWAMTGDQDALVRDSSEVGLGRTNHAVNAATGGVINEWVVAIPP